MERRLERDFSESCVLAADSRRGRNRHDPGLFASKAAQSGSRLQDFLPGLWSKHVSGFGLKVLKTRDSLKMHTVARELFCKEVELGYLPREWEAEPIADRCGNAKVVPSRDDDSFF